MSDDTEMSETFTRRMWPTPCAQEDNKSPAAHMAMKRRMKGGARYTITSLQVMVKAEATGFEVPDAMPASNQLTLFAEAFPASPTPPLVDDWVPPTTATSGPSSGDSFASLDPDGLWLKMSQGCCQLTLDGSSEAFSETWPRAGMTRNGIAFQRLPLAPITDVTGFGLWPTPIANDQSDRPLSSDIKKLSCAVHKLMWPTPTARDWRSDKSQQSDEELYGTRGKPLPRVVGGQLNPTWVEWLMGYPLGWTACEGSATASSRKSRNGYLPESRKQKRMATARVIPEP